MDRNLAGAALALAIALAVHEPAPAYSQASGPALAPPSVLFPSQPSPKDSLTRVMQQLLYEETQRCMGMFMQVRFKAARIGAAAAASQANALGAGHRGIAEMFGALHEYTGKVSEIVAGMIARYQEFADGIERRHGLDSAAGLNAFDAGSREIAATPDPLPTGFQELQTVAGGLGSDVTQATDCARALADATR